jgi:hypothetical protein
MCQPNRSVKNCSDFARSRHPISKYTRGAARFRFVFD